MNSARNTSRDGAAEKPPRVSSEAAEQLLSSSGKPLSKIQAAAQPSTDKEERMLWRTAKSITVIEDRIKRFAKMRSNDTLTRFVARLQEVEKMALSYEEDEARLVLRPKINRQGAKPHWTTIRLGKRGEQKEQNDAKQKVGGADSDRARDTNVWGLCLYKDPLLLAGANPEESEAQITEWLRCDNDFCTIWVHAACSREHKLCIYCKNGHCKPCVA